jgi:hypothetical protein
MKELDLFMPHILPFAPGCAEPTAFYGIRQAAIDFCERTRLWRYEDEFTVSTDLSEAIMAPYGAVVHEIEQVLFDGQPLEPKTTQWLDQRQIGWRAGSLSGRPNYVTQTAPDTLQVVPAYAGTVNLSLWLKPSQDCDELPDFMVDQYRETIAHGALGRILITPNQSFTSLDLAAIFAQRFAMKIDSLSTKGSTGQQRAPLRTRASNF